MDKQAGIPMKTKFWQIAIVIIAAIVTFFAARSGMKVDQINRNEKVNIQQAGEIRALQQNEERTYQALIRIENKIDNLKK
jgi:uncharacterized protein YlxW (UPF0749 family)